MKASDMLSSLAEPEECPDGLCGAEEEEDDDVFDEEDFWEAVDMLASSKNCMEHLLKWSGDLTASRRHMMQELCDDIGQFTALFLDTGDEEK